MELDRAIAVLVNALSLSSWMADEASPPDHVAQDSEQDVDQPLSTSEQDPPQVAEELPVSSEKCSEARQKRAVETTPAWKCQLYLQFPLGSRLQQNENVSLPTEVPAKEGDTENPSLREQNTVTRDLDVTFPDLQSKIWQLEDTLDELNEEFLQLSFQTLKLQREGNEEGQEEKLNMREEDEPKGKTLESSGPRSDQALLLEVKRTHLAQRIEDVEWELSFLLHLADPSIPAGADQLDRHASLDFLPLH
ncbi:uncharacterized protein LOC141508023 [Macrotis lagotis]|uniref:uncharacterized protein LOC141508023 n=1 Tax=Macrotis lagotis TaxID=92651 RepID=UPI003D69570C